jgi:hypothetical protein
MLVNNDALRKNLSACRPILTVIDREKAPVAAPVAVPRSNIACFEAGLHATRNLILFSRSILS